MAGFQWKWLFCSENCAAVIIFGQKMAARPQGQKKNNAQIQSHRKAQNDRKAPKEYRIFLENIFPFKRISE